MSAKSPGVISTCPLAASLLPCFFLICLMSLSVRNTVWMSLSSSRFNSVCNLPVTVISTFAEEPLPFHTLAATPAKAVASGYFSAISWWLKLFCCFTSLPCDIKLCPPTIPAKTKNGKAGRNGKPLGLVNRGFVYGIPVGGSGICATRNCVPDTLGWGTRSGMSGPGSLRDMLGESASGLSFLGFALGETGFRGGWPGGSGRGFVLGGSGFGFALRGVAGAGKSPCSGMRSAHPGHEIKCTVRALRIPERGRYRGEGVAGKRGL